MKETNQPDDRLNDADKLIQQQILTRLYEDSKVDEQKMTVEVTDGKVLLKGKADTEEEKQYAESIAAAVPGVKEVENQLHVELGIAHALSFLVSQIAADTEKDKNEDENKEPS